MKFGPDINRVRENISTWRERDDLSLRDKAALAMDSSQSMGPGMRGADVREIPGGEFVAGKAVGGLTGTGKLGEVATHASIAIDGRVADHTDELRAGRPQLASMDDETDMSTYGLDDAGSLQHGHEQTHEADGHSLGH
jgi:hypothetical protein